MTNLNGYAARYKIIIAMRDAARGFSINSATNSKSRFEDEIMREFCHE